jgi:hypothetical protein
MVGTTNSVISDDFIQNIASKMAKLVSNLTNNLAYNLKLSQDPNSPTYVNNKNKLFKDKWTDASNNYKDAPLKLSLAEKNYFHYNKGASTEDGDALYNMTIIDRFAGTAQELRQNSIEKQQEFMANLTQALKQYQGEMLFAERTEQLLQIRQEENADLTKKLDMYNRILQTSERKVVYETKSTTSLYTYRRVMLFIYYAAIVCYIIFSNFISDKLYLKKSIWVIIIIISLIPLILNLLIKWIMIIGDVIAYWFSKRPHKDMYADIKDGTYNNDMGKSTNITYPGSSPVAPVNPIPAFTNTRPILTATT